MLTKLTSYLVADLYTHMQSVRIIGYLSKYWVIFVGINVRGFHLLGMYCEHFARLSRAEQSMRVWFLDIETRI